MGPLLGNGLRRGAGQFQNNFARTFAARFARLNHGVAIIMG